MLILRHTQIFSKAILFGWAFGTEDFRLKLSSALQQLNVEACRADDIMCSSETEALEAEKGGAPRKRRFCENVP